jgi:ribosomal protein S27E
MSAVDFPFTEVAEEVDTLLKRYPGRAQVFFKFTCVGCGTRQMFDEPNKLYTTGSCEECGAVTDLQEKGCNYLLQLGGL